jgi:hypothetical protein
VCGARRAPKGVRESKKKHCTRLWVDVAAVQEAGPGTGTSKSWRWDGVEAHWDRLSPQSEAYAVLLCRLSHKYRVNKPAG